MNLVRVGWLGLDTTEAARHLQRTAMPLPMPGWIQNVPHGPNGGTSLRIRQDYDDAAAGDAWCEYGQ